MASYSYYTGLNASRGKKIVSRSLKNFLLAILASAVTASPAWSDDWRLDDISRVVAIADIHGEYSGMTETLQQAGILNEEMSWTGGAAHLVVVGDILDRGPDSRAAMDLLMRIEAEAIAAGGRVHVLIGNHESMLLTGDMRYVSDAEYAAFAADENAAERARWFELYVARRNGFAEALLGEFDEKFPPGYFAMRRAFRANGRYGAWLLQKNIISVINGTAFVHGGLSPEVAELGLQGVNKDLQQVLVDYVKALGSLTDAEVLLPTDSHYDYQELLVDQLPSLVERPDVLAAAHRAIRLGDSILFDVDGPLWYRENVTCPGIVEEHRVDAALAAIGATRVVVGHTPTPNRQVLQRFDGRIIEIDTGMLGFYYQGSGNALVLEGDDIAVINQSGARTAGPVLHPRRVGRRAGDLTPGQLQRLLQHGEIIASENGANGRSNGASPTINKVSDGTHTVSAIFKKRGGKGFYPNIAAYRLDRLLQLDMVPVTAMRKLDGKQGSLQFLPDNRTDEFERSASGSGGGAVCPITDQWTAMYVFDVLIYNEGRSQQRMLYDRSSWQLMLSEHERAFSTRKGRPAHLKGVALPVSPGWKQTLSELTDPVLAEHLGDVLDKRRLRALAARRDELLATPTPPGAD